MSEAHLSPGTTLEGRFVVERAISAGGMGEVYRGLDLETKIPVAIKRMLLQASDDEEQVDQTGLTVNYHKERFLKEAQVLSNLELPGIPRCLAHFFLDGRAYIVMEFVDGTDLEKEVRDLNQLAGVKMEPAKAVGYIIQVCHILEYLHALRPHPIVHRDVKPANIIVRPDGKVHLVDFGLARSLGGDTATKSMVGTAGYAPIEQYHGKPEPASDQYALGVTLHFLLTGIPPVPFKIEPIRQVRPGLPEELCQIISKSIQYERNYRYDDVRAMRQALEKVLPALKHASPVASEAQQLETSGGLSNLSTERLGHSELAKAILAAKREKLSVHQEAPHEFDDFGHKEPIVDRSLSEGSFQAEAVRANRISRGVVDVEPEVQEKSGFGKQLAGLVVLLLAGVLFWAHHTHSAGQAALVQRLLPNWKVLRASGLGPDRIGVALGVPTQGLAGLMDRSAVTGLQAEAPGKDNFEQLKLSLEPLADSSAIHVLLSNSGDCTGYLVQAKKDLWYVEKLNSIAFPPTFEEVRGESSFAGKGHAQNQPLLLKAPKGFTTVTLLANRATAATAPRIRGLNPGK